ncbi:hypothetical protein ABH944_000910 [Caballeronia udeis]|uniref:Uncharacterized protein n=1 Tax=Caballeronia udeis TaxID=1232866 RepID=A0ABW8MAX1_9BURK
MNQSFTLSAEIEQAAAGTDGQKYIAARAAANLADAARIERKSAAEDGTRIKVSQFVRVVDGSESWPSSLADLLIQSPELATESNAALCKLIGQKLGVMVDKQRLSRKLSRPDRKAVSTKLSNAGYDGALVKLGTDIKRAVAGVKKAAGIPFAGKTEFLADGVRIDGTKLSYMLRPRATLTGNAWQDFCVKIAGDLVSLTVLLRMRAVSIGEFQLADQTAIASGDTESLARRNALRRVPQSTSPRIEPPPVDLSETAELARVWWHALSPVRKATVGFWDMLHHLRSQSEDKEAAADAMRRLDSWAERQTAGWAVPAQSVKECCTFVGLVDGSRLEVDMYSNPYVDTDAFETNVV